MGKQFQLPVPVHWKPLWEGEVAPTILFVLIFRQLIFQVEAGWTLPFYRVYTAFPAQLLPALAKYTARLYQVQYPKSDNYMTKRDADQSTVATQPVLKMEVVFL